LAVVFLGAEDAAVQDEFLAEFLAAFFAAGQAA